MELTVIVLLSTGLLRKDLVVAVVIVVVHFSSLTLTTSSETRSCVWCQVFLRQWTKTNFFARTELLAGNFSWSHDDWWV
jgi:hypothetical protein